MERLELELLQEFVVDMIDKSELADRASDATVDELEVAVKRLQETAERTARILGERE